MTVFLIILQLIHTNHSSKLQTLAFNWHTNCIFQGFKCDLLCWCPLQNRITEMMWLKGSVLKNNLCNNENTSPLLSPDCFGTRPPPEERWSHLCSFFWTACPHLEKRNSVYHSLYSANSSISCFLLFHSVCSSDMWQAEVFFCSLTSILWDVRRSQPLCVITASSKNLGDLRLKEQNTPVHLFHWCRKPEENKKTKKVKLIVCIHCVL